MSLDCDPSDCYSAVIQAEDWHHEAENSIFLLWYSDLLPSQALIYFHLLCLNNSGLLHSGCYTLDID